MKATIEIPDELYRKVKARSAIEGRRIRDVTVELYRRWLGEAQADSSAGQSGQEWLAELLKHRIAAGTPGPTAREILEEDRNRLEPRTRRAGSRR